MIISIYSNILRTALRQGSKFLVILLILATTACEDEAGFIGKNLLPSSDFIITRLDTLTAVAAYTTTAKPINTRFNTRLLLGEINDVNFGKATAEVLLPYYLSKIQNLGSGRFVDSLILNLDLDGYYGDTLQQTIRVFEITKKLEYDSLYYSDENAADWINPLEIASATFYPTDSTIRVKIEDIDFLHKFSSTPDTVFKDPLDFTDAFRGFYLKTDAPSGSGSICYIDSLLNTSTLKLYFKNDSTLAISDTISALASMVFFNEGPKINIFSHDFTGSRAAVNLDQIASADSLLFVTGMAGLDIRLSFPDISKWRDSTGFAINKAELILPASGSFTQLAREVPEKLFLWTIDENEKLDYVYDYLTDNSQSSDRTKTRIVFNGYYRNIRKDAYVFNIGRHFQSYIMGDIDKFEFLLRSSSGNLFPQRAVLGGPTATGNKIQLRITYTKPL